MRIFASSEETGEDFIVVRKEWGEHVHQPENKDFWIPLEKVLVTQLKKKLGRQVFPIHRLDAPTRGLLIFALSSQTAGDFAKLLASRELEKKYLAVVRGWTKKHDAIDIPLELDTTGDLVAAETHYELRARIEHAHAVGKLHSSARYSLIELNLKSGRYHQIRRHLNRISHPVIGDREHGDSHHNRYFREVLDLPQLCLWAHSLNFKFRGKSYAFKDEPDPTWQKIFSLFSEPLPDQ